MVKLLAAVGAGGVNAHVDVTAVQNLLNQSIRTITPLALLREGYWHLRQPHHRSDNSVPATSGEAPGSGWQDRSGRADAASARHYGQRRNLPPGTGTFHGSASCASSRTQYALKQQPERTHYQDDEAGHSGGADVDPCRVARPKRAGSTLARRPLLGSLAFRTLPDGVAYWINRHQKVASNHSTYVASLNAGKCDLVAHFLKVDKYYTGLEGAYAHSMTMFEAQLDRTLGTAA